MPQHILNEDWSDYDNKKKKGIDSRFFSCEENWEVDYLLGKIRKYYPGYSETQVRQAIAACCRTVPPPRGRETFVRCVMQRLKG